MAATLTGGIDARGLHFTTLEQGEGPLVLCLHGFPDHARSFRHQLPALADAGYRAVAPLLRGYEPGSQPGPEARHYHPIQVAEDAIAQAAALSPQPVHLVGHDWGGIAAYAAVALAPERFRSLTTIAVAGPRAMRDGLRRVSGQLRNSWYVFFFQLRGLADWTVERSDFAFVERLWRDWSPGWAWDPEDMAALKRTLGAPGVRRAALGYYRAMLNPFLEDSRRLGALAQTPIEVPTLAITGALDGCLDTRIHDGMDPADFPAGLRIERIDDGGHFVHQECPAAVNDLLLEWLRAH